MPMGYHYCDNDARLDQALMSDLSVSGHVTCLGHVV